MIDELVSDKTAKLASVLGFNERCRYAVFKYEGRCELNHTKRNSDLVKWDEIVCMVPTQSLLQKWLRVKWDVDVYPERSHPTYHVNEPITHNHDNWQWNNKWICSIDEVASSGSVNDGKHTIIFDGYDVALEAGLMFTVEYLIQEHIVVPTQKYINKNTKKTVTAEQMDINTFISLKFPEYSNNQEGVIGYRVCRKFSEVWMMKETFESKYSEKVEETITQHEPI